MPPFSGPDLCRLTATEAVRRLKAGEVSPAEMLEAAYARITQVEPAVNAMPILCRDRAEAQLAALDGLRAEGPGWLAGLPIAIKDLTHVKGVVTSFGNTVLAGNVATESDPLVDRLERRGGVIVGKTNTPEFGAGGNTFNEVFGATRNPWDTRKNAGGSSGGAAVSLATGEVWLSHGSDLAGSLRTPAGYCGVVGLRPSPGRAGGGPGVAAFLMEGIAGPMARNVTDVALFLDAMAGFDPRQPLSLEAPSTPFQAAVAGAGADIRVACAPDQNGFAPVEPEIRAVLARAMQTLSGAGMRVVEACPELPELHDTYVTLRGFHYAAVTAAQPPEVQAAFKETLRQNVEFGLRLEASAIVKAQRDRTILYHRMRLFLQDHDVLALPVVGIEPGPVEQEYPPFVDGQPVRDYVDWLRFSFLATTTALPALVLPCGFTASGMPVGLQLIGGPRGEAGLLRAARAIEIALAFPQGPIDPVVRRD